MAIDKISQYSLKSYNTPNFKGETNKEPQKTVEAKDTEKIKASNLMVGATALAAVVLGSLGLYHHFNSKAAKKVAQEGAEALREQAETVADTVGEKANDIVDTVTETVTSNVDEAVDFAVEEILPKADEAINVVAEEVTPAIIQAQALDEVVNTGENALKTTEFQDTLSRSTEYERQMRDLTANNYNSFNPNKQSTFGEDLIPDEGIKINDASDMFPSDNGFDFHNSTDDMFPPNHELDFNNTTDDIFQTDGGIDIDSYGTDFSEF